MTGRSTLAAGLAVAASLAVHAAVLSRITPPEGGTATETGSAPLSMRGQSFEDLAAGTSTPATAPGQAVRATELSPVSAAPAAITPATASPVGTLPAISATPDAVVASTAIPTAPRPAAIASDTPAAADSIPARDATVALRPTHDTPRPEARPPAPAPQLRGTSDRDASAGTPQGTPAGTAPQRQGDVAAAPGPSAREIARYPQLVNRHLGRLRRPASRFSGTAIVGFTIAADGGLASLGIVQSSGDAGFDDLALRHIQGAVPFPPPPDGAETRFSVSVRGR
jgi:protein TonB